MVICILNDLLSGFEVCRLSGFPVLLCRFSGFRFAFRFSGIQEYCDGAASHDPCQADASAGQTLLLCTNVDVTIGAAFVLKPPFQRPF
jgi:hypothetical protein